MKDGLKVFSNPVSNWDLDEVAHIQKLSYSVPWEPEQWGEYLSDRSNTMRVVRVVQPGSPTTSRIGAFYAYTTAPGTFFINMMAVHPDFRGCGVGKFMLDEVEGQKRKAAIGRLVVQVIESNDSAQKWLKRQGFICTEIVDAHDSGLDVGRDWYVFERGPSQKSLTRKAAKIRGRHATAA